MATNKSTENLLKLSESSGSFQHVRPNKRIISKRPKPKDNRLGSAESSFNNDVQMVRTIQSKTGNSKQRTLEETVSGFTTTSYGVWDKARVSTTADVHRPNEQDSESSAIPVPLPRRKLADESTVISSSSDADEHNDVHSKASMFFSQSRQNTIISQHDDNSSKPSNSKSGISKKIDPPIPKPRSKLVVTAKSNINSTNISSTSSSQTNNQINAINNDAGLTKRQIVSTPSRESENMALDLDQNENEETGEDVSTSDCLSDSSNATPIPATVYTINEKNYSKAVPKSTRKSKSKSTDILSNEESSRKYSYEKLIGIFIHDSTPLNFDYVLITPMVRVSLYDVVSGRLLLKSDSNRSAVQHKEPETVNFIQPVVSRSCTFKKSPLIECVWEELLLINDDIQCLQTGNEILFFEIVSMVNMANKDFANFGDTDGWHHICWAFLRPGDGLTYSHIDQRSRLQLFRYKTKGFLKPRNIPIMDQWRLKRKKYPATLDVTLKGIQPTSGQQVSMKTRPMHALEEDIQLDYCSTPSGQELLEKHITNADLSNDMHSGEVDSIAHLLGRDRKLPGQTCKVPNHVNATLHQSQTKGCIVSKFSPNGQQLAFALIPETNNQQHDIVIVQVPGFRKLSLLQGHTAVVYSLFWCRADDDLFYLLSVSSDRTAIVWRLNRGCVNLSLSILPHPCFVYAGVILSGSLPKKGVYAVTGGRDCVLRVWKSSENKVTELVQELQGHESYITSVISSRNSKTLYTSDSSGCILEWKRELTIMFEKTRIIKSLYSNIRCLQLHRNEETLFASCSTVISLNIRSGVQLHTFDPNTDQNVSFAVSPCGSLIVTTSASTLQGWNLLTGQKTTAFTIPLHVATDRHNYISSIDFHPQNFKLSITIYGSNQNAGVTILDNDEIHQRLLPSPDVFPPPAIESPKKPKSNNAFPKQQDLGHIIQRIDDIFRLPQNRTDDLKSRSVSQVANRNREPSGTGPQTVSNRLSSHAMTLQRSATFTVDNEEKANNETFSISGRRHVPRVSGTYNVPANIGDDDTTISESL